MALEKVRTCFQWLDITDRIIEFDASIATVALAAQKLHCPPSRIAKTISFMTDHGVILIVTSGDTKIDNTKYRTQFGVKTKMLAPEEVEPLVGHAIGGVCPFAIHPEVKVYLDRSLQRFESIYPSCGSSNSTIELTISELERYSNYVAWIDVSKLMN
ncbi:MAG: YbaK/EbsC family protein [Verrucomicrobiota bacterium]|nr:MAG: YbaK/EbsC family protein [Verrucomicrobiota bacterium]